MCARRRPPFVVPHKPSRLVNVEAIPARHIRFLCKQNRPNPSLSNPGYRRKETFSRQDNRPASELTFFQLNAARMGCYAGPFALIDRSALGLQIRQKDAPV